MKIVMRHAFYKMLGRTLAPDKNKEEQLEACMEVLGELMELEMSPKLIRFFLLCKTRPWMYDVFDLIKERRKKSAYEQRTKGAPKRQGYEDPAAEFFDLVKTHDGT